MNIRYRTDHTPEAELIAKLYTDSGLIRPVKDIKRIATMYDHSNLVITAWSDLKLVGIARSLCDFAYTCYLSDLAVDAEFQKMGIGKELIDKTRECAGPDCNLILLSADGAMEYYPKIGFSRITRGFFLDRENNS